MKKIAISVLIIFSLISVFSCDVVGDSSLKIDVSTIPSTVVKLHFAVLNGEDVLQQKVFLRSELESNGSIEVYVSPGENRTIVLVAECDEPDYGLCAGYYSSKTVDIGSGKEIVMNLSMKEATWSQSPTGSQNFFYQTYVVPYKVYWGTTGIVNTKYFITEEYFPYDIIYEGYGNEIDHSLVSGKGIYFIVEFYPFNLRTRRFYFSFV